MNRQIVSSGLALLLGVALVACNTKETPVGGGSTQPPVSQAPATGQSPAPQPQPLSKWPATFSVEQGDGEGFLVFHATGDLKAPKVEFHLEGKVLASTELKLQPSGEWTWSLPRPQERSEQIEIRLFSEGRLVGVAPMRYDTGVSQRWSNNFYVDPPRQLGEKSLFLKGKARAFEGVFIVEIRKEGTLIARQPLKAKEGAPVYGDFEETLTLATAIPPNAEVWFINESMKDSGDLVELIASIYEGK